MDYTSTEIEIPEIDVLRARVAELEKRDAENRRELEAKAIDLATHLKREADEREAQISAELARVEAKRFTPCPTTYAEWSALSRTQKTEVVSLYGCEVVTRCMSDKARQDRKLREEEIQRKLAASKPRFNQ